MSSSIVDIIKGIQDSQPAVVNLPVTAGEAVHLNGIYKESISPNFYLVFPPKKLPDNIDTEKSSHISIKYKGSAVTLIAKIVAVQGDRTIEFAANETIDPATLRNYFRINIRTSITAEYAPPANLLNSESWSMDGNTIDISGSGILAIFPKEFRNRNNINLFIDLPGLSKTINCTAKVIRMRRLRKGRWQIALNIDSILHKQRDYIVSCCLQEQRRQLREQVQTSL